MYRVIRTLTDGHTAARDFPTEEDAEDAWHYLLLRPEVGRAWMYRGAESGMMGLVKHAKDFALIEGLPTVKATEQPG